VRWANLQDLREYRNSYPNGRLHIYTLASYVLAASGIVGFAVFMLMAYQPLVVSVTSPADRAIFTAPANIVIGAEASEGDRSVSRVDFYQGTNMIGSSAMAPYCVTWSNVPAGNYSLTAKATDEQGTTTTSDAVRITVNTSREDVHLS
jgi:Bacterial Ig domain